MTDTNIHSRALLVWLAISTWSARRYDKQVSRKVNSDNGASENAGRFNKHLLPGDAKAYKDLTTLCSTIRLQHYSNTLAWSDEGWRLLPTANYMDYTTWFRGKMAEFDQLRDAFVQDYPLLKQAAQAQLGSLYKSEDYPEAADISNRFALSIRYMPVPAQGDIRVDLASDQVADIEAAMRVSLVSSTQMAMQDAWKRLHASVSHVADRLRQPDAIFRNSLISNAREVCDTLKRLNVTNDPDLEAMRIKVELELTSYDADIIRDAPAMRAQVAEKADAILAQMRDVYGVQS